MTNGLGVAFFSLTLLAVLSGLAGLLALTAVGVLVVHRRAGHVPTAAGYLAVALLAGVVAVSGFGVLALVDDAPVAAGLLVASVWLPLVAAGLRLRRREALSAVELLAAAATAWGLPFVVGVVAFVGLNVAASAVLGLAPGEARRLGVGWVAAGAAGLVAVTGTLGLAGRVAGWLSSASEG